METTKQLFERRKDIWRTFKAVNLARNWVRQAKKTTKAVFGRETERDDEAGSVSFRGSGCFVASLGTEERVLARQKKGFRAEISHYITTTTKMKVLLVLYSEVRPQIIPNCHFLSHVCRITCLTYEQPLLKLRAWNQGRTTPCLASPVPQGSERNPMSLNYYLRCWKVAWARKTQVSWTGEYGTHPWSLPTPTDISGPTYVACDISAKFWLASTKE